MEYKNLRNRVYIVPLLAGLSLFGSTLPNKANAQEGSNLEQRIGGEALKGDGYKPPKLLYEMGKSGRTVYKEDNPFLYDGEFLQIRPDIQEGKGGAILTEILAAFTNNQTTNGGEFNTPSYLSLIALGQFHQWYRPTEIAAEKLEAIKKEHLDYKRAVVTSCKILLGMEGNFPHTIREAEELLKGMKGVKHYTSLELQEVLERRLNEVYGYPGGPMEQLRKILLAQKTKQH